MGALTWEGGVTLTEVKTGSERVALAATLCL